ncbi:MAG: hypothetical protein OXS35_05540 [Dehalococcoidia bacterium]|nr:hypothetical protein [Dehalococcoidia bacterium]
MKDINYTHEWLTEVAGAARNDDETGLNDLAQWLDGRMIDDREKAALEAVLEMAWELVRS